VGFGGLALARGVESRSAMRLRSLAVSLAPLFATSFSVSIAHAQAPGQVQPIMVAPDDQDEEPGDGAPAVVQSVPAAPAYTPAPPPAVPPPPGCEAPCRDCRESVMANRWAVSFAVGGMSLSPKGSPDQSTGFAFGELALRFRATPHLELELSAGGGRQQLTDHMNNLVDGDLEVNTAAFAARWRFLPGSDWNWFAMAGVGGASLTSHDASQQERSDATQPFGMIGIGVERRFHNLALQAELRGIAMGRRSDVDDSAMSTGTPVPASADVERSGASFALGLGYYF
jgi:hypothetical protein